MPGHISRDECYFKLDFGRRTLEEEPLKGSTPSCHEGDQISRLFLITKYFNRLHSLILVPILRMQFLTFIVVFAATISALPITDTNTPAAVKYAAPNIADAADNNSVTASISAVADTKDGPNWSYGPPNGGGYSFNNGPGYGSGYGPPPRPHAPEQTGGLFESVGYGVGTIIGTPIGLLGDLVGGAGSGLYNGLKGGYRRKG